MRIFLAVQGEGRGHMTQAIALSSALRNRGHEIVGATVGTSGMREVPEFFLTAIGCKVIRLLSPNFITDRNGKGILIRKSIAFNLRKLPAFRRSIKQLKSEIEDSQADVVLNFYEPLVGLLYLLSRQKAIHVAVAHQYLYLHPDFQFPPVNRFQRSSLVNFTKLTAIGARKLIALSFYPMERMILKRLWVAAPLLRATVLESNPKEGNYILAYLLNAGYMAEIMEWHRQNSKIELHCFTDSKEVDGELKIDDTLTFHALDGEKFIRYMTRCGGVATTAGFESVCEAIYMGKPVLMVPVAGHFEQWCNSRDAQRAGAGVFAESFELDKLLAAMENYQQNTEFKSWAMNAPESITQLLEELIK